MKLLINVTSVFLFMFFFGLRSFVRTLEVSEGRKKLLPSRVFPFRERMGTKFTSANWTHRRSGALSAMHKQPLILCEKLESVAERPFGGNFSYFPIRSVRIARQAWLCESACCIILSTRPGLDIPSRSGQDRRRRGSGCLASFFTPINSKHRALQISHPWFAKLMNVDSSKGAR